MRVTVLTHRRVLQILPPAEGRREESAHKDWFQRHPGPGMLTASTSPMRCRPRSLPLRIATLHDFHPLLVALNGPLGTC
jgi:hypothetical protein